MSMKKVIGTAALAFTLGLFAHPGIYPNISTYGLSVGTNTHYCSLDLVHGVPEASCEVAQ